MAETDKQDQEVRAVTPGTVVLPGSGAQPAPIAPQPTPVQPPTPPPAPTPPQPAQPQAPPASPAERRPSSPAEAQVEPDQADEVNAVSWTASEFVSHDKSAEWYLLLLVGAISAAGLMFLVTWDLISAGVVIMAAIIFGIYGSHKPRQLRYRVDLRGVMIGDKFYSYNDFHSFSVVPEDAFSSIVLMPLKRFAIPLTLYYSPQDEEKIVGLMALQLPYEQRRRDAVDTLMRKIRF